MGTDVAPPVIVTRDFNAAAKKNTASATHAASGFLTNTWMTASERVGEGIGTFNSFKSPQPGGPRIAPGPQFNKSLDTHD